MVDEIKKEETNSENTEKVQAAKPSVKKIIPDFKVGDTVKVFVKIQEGENKFRLQPFEGTVISRRGSKESGTFSVRKVSFGEGVERTFPVNTPSIDRIEVLHQAKRMRKSKLYFLRLPKNKSYKIEEQGA